MGAEVVLWVEAHVGDVCDDFLLRVVGEIRATEPLLFHASAEEAGLEPVHPRLFFAIVALASRCLELLAIKPSLLRQQVSVNVRFL